MWDLLLLVATLPIGLFTGAIASGLYMGLAQLFLGDNLRNAPDFLRKIVLAGYFLAAIAGGVAPFALTVRRMYF